MSLFVHLMCSISNVYLFHLRKWLSADEMNKFTLILVFLCGVIFAGLISVLKSGLYFKEENRIFSSETDLALLDDGYIMMAELGMGCNKELEVKEIENFKNERKRSIKERHTDIEAVNSVKVALEMVAIGKSSRAGRLLDHAHKLAPHHPDILLIYGEFLETHMDDIVKADHLYLKALTLSPSNSRALRNRRRTQSIVEKIDSSVLSRIESKRDELAKIPLSSAPLRRIQREAYFQHIYHTASIEGNTLTLAQIRMILETGLSVGGKSIMEHNEVLGIDLALKYINTTLVHRIGHITLNDILEIHKRVLGHVDPIGAGTLRTTQVYVSNHAPPGPHELESLLNGFLSWLNSPDTEKMHPIKYAALAHYKLVFIHPFVDGNGRTARLLMNFLLMQAGYPPVIIRKQDRLQYYEYLQEANDGDTRPFVRFIGHCMEKMLDVYLWSTKDHLPEIDGAHSSPTDKSEKHELEVPKKVKLNALAFLNRAGVGDDTIARSDETDFVLDVNTYHQPEITSGWKGWIGEVKTIDEKDSQNGPHEWLMESNSYSQHSQLFDSDSELRDVVQDVESIGGSMENILVPNGEEDREKSTSNVKRSHG